LVVLKKQKTCIVVFRGTVRTDEWLTDANAKLVPLAEKIKTLSAISEISGIGADVRVHAGFARALFAKWREGHNGENFFDSTYNCIVQVLEKYKDYTVKVTGHSLGGALTTLMVYAAAHDSRLKTRGVFGLAAASPRVGNFAFKESFENLDTATLVRLCRPGDIVTCLPQVSMRSWKRYYHVYQHPVLFVSPKDISAHISAIQKRSWNPLVLFTTTSFKRAFEKQPTATAASPAAPVGARRSAEPRSPLRACEGVGRSVFEQIDYDKGGKMSAIFRLVIGQSIEAHSSKAYSATSIWSTTPASTTCSRGRPKRTIWICRPRRLRGWRRRARCAQHGRDERARSTRDSTCSDTLGSLGVSRACKFEVTLTVARTLSQCRTYTRQ
jgi:hypothetical protein